MNTLKTYLVEDSPVIRESLIATLEELVPVLVVGTAEDEMSATLWLGQPGNQADLVIVDIFLKSGSGLGVLKAARGQAAARHLVVLSNYATADMRRQCLALGAARVFDKSNDIDALMDYCAALAQGDLKCGDESGHGHDDDNAVHTVTAGAYADDRACELGNGPLVANGRDRVPPQPVHYWDAGPVPSRGPAHAADARGGRSLAR